MKPNQAKKRKKYFEKWEDFDLQDQGSMNQQKIYHTQLKTNQIYQMDCLEGMKLIPDESVDMILSDLPYAMTGLKWDVIIPFDELWHQYKRIIKPSGNIVLTCSQPFTTQLGANNLEWLQYGLVWEKENGTSFVQCHERPMKIHEDILVFYEKRVDAIRRLNLLAPIYEYLQGEKEKAGLKLAQVKELLGNNMHRHYFSKTTFTIPSEKDWLKLQTTGYFGHSYDVLKQWKAELTSDVKRTYNPQKVLDGFMKKPPQVKGGQMMFAFGAADTDESETAEISNGKFPTSILKVQRETGIHPTQKPVALFEWLIKTYSNKGELVFDGCVGSGTTGIAAINTGRDFIGLEKNGMYFKVADERIKAQIEGMIR